jgi:hypothetical protein
MVLSNNPEYPRDWPSTGAEQTTKCPDLSGIYSNAGDLYIEAGINCARSKSKAAPGSEEGFWNCKLELAPNLGISTNTNAETVEIGHPDAEALSVT